MRPTSRRSSSSKTNSTTTHGLCDIAIIGLSFLLPEANSTESFWDLLISGKCVASEFPPERLCNSRHHDGGNDGTGTIRPQKASFIRRNISSFDARFFMMTSEEAAAMDPQQRILLETTYRALENAGIPMAMINNSDTSVHTGCFTTDYALNYAKDPDNLPKYAATGMAGSMLSNRISTFFGLTGPSITVDTACSSSLVALDLACQSIIDGRSKMGIVAGCNLLLTTDLFISLSNLGFLSPDGVCHSFDSRANGYGRGEGFGVLIIKPVDAAVRDGDIIRAVIRAVGTNQNGHTNLAQPNKEMQRQLIQNTYHKANLDMSQTRYFEAHGTGTASGDPLEASAIGDAFRSGRDPSNPLVVGAVKANIGHLEGAAGIAGVIKTILILENGIIPPVAELENINENIDTEFLNLKVHDASALSANFVTAYHSLVVVAKLSQGESILIHSGAGGTGQAAIQIAKTCGAQVFTTVSSPKKELINTLYDIPMDNILNSRDLSFADGIRRLTRNRGVDVVLNSLAGDALIASWECVASFGRFIEIGKKDIFSHNKLPMFQFARNVSFSAVDIAAMVREKPKLIRDSLVAISDLFNKGVLQLPSPVKAFPISQVEAAFRYLQTGANSGKVVVEVDPNDSVLAAVTHISSWTFSQDETFVIAGGLGGQGRSISKWMVSKGARNLVLLSRAGPRDDNSVGFIRSLEKKGATVYTPPCDISEAASLGAVIDYCKLHMPPIKGCIQAAMDIRDSIFENMSHEAWTASLKPKIRGSWNLHQLLPRDLDFFIMFSSISGIIGSQGQSNYAVGNTFQDELAKYRLSRGEKVISLDLGILSGDGYLAENQDFLIRFAKIKQMLPIDEAEVLALLEHFCDKSLPLDPTRSQLVLGLDLPQNIISRGLEPSSWTYEPMFANLQQMTTATPISTDADATTDNGSKLAEKVAASESLSEAADILANGLAMKVGTIFSMSRESFDLNQPLHNYGVDSLIAVELRNWFIKTLKVDLAVFEILGGATAMMLGQAAAEKMRSWT
ncbi:Lovastatin diketide synthase LovF [Daldinia childiae]|uniref:Lovastatin diketide synthase LovF n=1 Tax=Daldinia childiae TaxID=326645 RepID=UPI001444E4B0|nr:Lovastatin diketide synthase LovF [Daldinia childiae]KAF3057128.1 Lovastatin diketide synthase LovF [Daldinia childiae]